MQTAEGNVEGGATLSTLYDSEAGRKQGQRRKDTAHALLDSKRRSYIEQARLALMSRIIDFGSATADDVAEEIGPPPEGIDPRLLGAVPGALAQAGLIRRSGFTASRRPSRHASVISTWEVADWRKVLYWVIVNLRALSSKPTDGDGTPSPTTSKSPSPEPHSDAFHQSSLF